jgi:hypothetical protein
MPSRRAASLTLPSQASSVRAMCSHSSRRRLARLGVEVPLADRLATTAHDIVGMAPAYAPIIGVGFAIAFPIAALVIRRVLPGWRAVGYPLAGFVAVAAALATMIALFEITPIAGARSAAGFVCQALAGAVGGHVFARLLPTPAPGPATASTAAA